MKGSGRDEEEPPAGEMEEMDREAKERQAPLPPRPAVPVYQGLRVELVLGETGSQEAGRMVNGQVTEQLEEEQEERPTLEGPHNRAKHPAPQGPQSPEDVVHELQRRKEPEERNLLPGRGLVRKQGTDWVSAKPSRGEVRDKSNTTCQGCRVTFGERKLFLQHCRLAHGWRLKAKRGLSHPSPSPKGPPGHLYPPIKRSPRTRGLSLPPAQVPDARDGRPGPMANAQLGGRPNPQGMKLGAFQAPGLEDHTE